MDNVARENRNVKPRKTISLSAVKKLKPCADGLEWLKARKTTSLKKLAEAAIADGKFMWAIWLATRLMDKTQNVRFAIFCAEQCLKIYEDKYPEDKRPRLAIEAAENWANKQSDAAWAANAAARAAASDAAWTANDAANDAARAAARAAAWAANDAASDAARDAAWAARAAAWAAAWAANDAANDAARAAARAAAWAANDAASDAARDAAWAKMIRHAIAILIGEKSDE